MSTKKYENNILRFDLQIVSSWIEQGTRVLDLGCGEGHLLYYLKNNKEVIGTGIECDEDKVEKSIAKGLSVLQGDINEEVSDYPDNTFDYVILSQTLQQVYEPDKLIKEILRIGNKGIVTFPNFSHWRARMQHLITGYAPVTKQLPFQWYDTPNIRVITLKDFRRFSREVGFNVIREAAINTNGSSYRGKLTGFLSNLRATYGIFLIGKR